MLREKFSVAYRKYKLDGIESSWPLFEYCAFLHPFVNLKPELKKEQDEPMKFLERPPRSPFDETVLTTLVRDRPVLYDKQHEDFRTANLRKRAWQEIAASTGWDISTLQRRWRVMRDRFVRELRRTKNFDGDASINCSVFFRSMLFLVRHVKSKNYEAEATEDPNNSDDSNDNWELQESIEDDSKKSESLETFCVVQAAPELTGNSQILEGTTDSGGQVIAYAMDDANEYDEYDGEVIEQVQYAEVEDDMQGGDDTFDDEEDAADQTAEEQLLASENEEAVVAVQELSEEHWFQQTGRHVSNRKRRASFTEQDVMPIKREATRSESPSVSIERPTRASNASDSLDEDMVFGNLIGAMLKKIPSNLKTLVKLKLMQGLDEFEREYKLK